MMKTIQKFFILSSSALMTLSLTVFSSVALAQQTSSETPWGGMHLVTLGSDVCTCSGNSYWILNYQDDSVLLLYKQDGQSVFFSNNNADGTYQLGTYSQSSQPCSIDVDDECVDLDNDGTYGSMPGTGTTLTQANVKGMLALFEPYQASEAPKYSYVDSIKNTSKGFFSGMTF